MNTTVFTDGASRRNPGPGGWAALVVIGDRVTELGGGDPHTTNNRMELSGVIEALHFLQGEGLEEKASATLYTDSSYVLNGATKWIHGWKNTGWKTKTKEEVLNRDLWEMLAPLLTHFRIEWNLLKGHSGIAANERCDVIATTFADQKPIALYEGALDGYSIDVVTPVVSKSDSGKAANKSNAKPYAYVSAIEGNVKVHKSWADCEKRVKGVSGARFKKVFSPEEQESLIKAWRLSNDMDS